MVARRKTLLRVASVKRHISLMDAVPAVERRSCKLRDTRCVHTAGQKRDGKMQKRESKQTLT